MRSQSGRSLNHPIQPSPQSIQDSVRHDCKLKALPYHISGFHKKWHQLNRKHIGHHCDQLELVHHLKRLKKKLLHYLTNNQITYLSPWQVSCEKIRYLFLWFLSQTLTYLSLNSTGTYLTIQDISTPFGRARCITNKRQINFHHNIRSTFKLSRFPPAGLKRLDKFFISILIGRNFTAVTFPLTSSFVFRQAGRV